MLTPGDATFHTTGLVSAKSRDEQAQHTAQIVVRPYDAEDVVASLRFAQEVNIDVAVISGGGHPSKFVEVDDGLLLNVDLEKYPGEPDRSMGYHPDRGDVAGI